MCELPAILPIHAAAILDRKRGRVGKQKMAAPSASTTWSRNLARVPPLTQQIVDDWANETAKIPRAKQTKGYSNFIEGYIHDVEVQVQAKATDSCKIRARAYPSMKKNGPPYSLTNSTRPSLPCTVDADTTEGSDIRSGRKLRRMAPS
ncbi:hypothetical protein Bbelb_048960 [Branchiostoma belcheri]|nr:hypothetical protein Bbelb_048960 [Branchiostoma belcheri]